MIRLPEKIRLETSTICQLKCPSCSTTRGVVKDKIGAGMLTFENFKKIINGNPWLSEIELSNYGEIFLNPRLGEMIRYAHQKNVALFAANGANLNTVKRSVLEDLVKFKFRFLSCSIDGASQQTYVHYRRNGNFDTVIDNIRQINEYKAKYSSVYPKLHWQFVAFGHNQHEMEIARKLAQSLNMEFFVKLSWDPNFSPVTDHLKVAQASGTGVSNRKEFEKLHGTSYASRTCHQLWREPQVNYDGKFLGCCVNLWGDFGENVFRVGLKRALNGTRLRDAKLMLQGKLEPVKDVPCTSCAIFKGRQKNADWIKPHSVLLDNKSRLVINWRLGRLRVAVVNHVQPNVQLILRATKGFFRRSINKQVQSRFWNRHPIYRCRPTERLGTINGLC